jgi:hypothetical protein
LGRELRISATAYRGIRVAAPREVGQFLSFVRALWLTVAEDGDVMQWVVSSSIVEGIEHPPLMVAARRGLGALAPLSDQPGAVTSTNESDDGLSLFMLSCLFGWDCWLVPKHRDGAIVFFSHDAYAEVYAPVSSSIDLQHDFSFWNTEIEVLQLEL